MSYIVRTFGLGCDEAKCSTYVNACTMARAISRSGYLAIIIDADAPTIRWHVTGKDVEPYDVLARSADEAICKVQFATNDYAYDTVQVSGMLKVVVERPDGTTDTIDCMCLDEAMKYARRYNERGWRAHVRVYEQKDGE